MKNRLASLRRAPRSWAALALLAATFPALAGESGIAAARATYFAGAQQFIAQPQLAGTHGQVWEARGDGRRLGWLIMDAVIGKHEPIDFALALDAQARVLGLEILEYRESYGYEVRDPGWRAQFRGLDAQHPPEFGESVDGISGATLSSRHLSEAVHAWLQRMQALA
ncbi:MAG TPA: FMN-binding protein [Solimonas sp.]|nr:FMN-binding protein [Solimonas sp.]